MEAFSDGVFAIAITLLILAVGIDGAPHGDLGSYLDRPLAARTSRYAASFLTIGIMWINHHLHLPAVRTGRRADADPERAAPDVDRLRAVSDAHRRGVRALGAPIVETRRCSTG